MSPPKRSNVFFIGPKKLFYLKVFLFTGIFFWTTLFMRPLRNVILRPVIYPAWHMLDTSEILRIHYLEPRLKQDEYVSVCGVKKDPPLQKSDVDSSGFLMYNDVLDNATLMDEIAEKSHALYLPHLTFEKKLDTIYLFSVMSLSLKSSGIEFFLVAGSILGLNRHGGFVPWDDDIDISISVAKWRETITVLDCIQDFKIFKYSDWHWKFTFKDNETIFIDVFFYKSNENYVWAMAHYIRMTYIYPKELVFPIKEAKYEGLTVPVPSDSLAIVRRIYNYDECKVFRGHMDLDSSKIEFQNYPNAFSVKSTDCRNLLYLYKMHHLDCS